MLKKSGTTTKHQSLKTMQSKQPVAGIIAHLEKYCHNVIFTVVSGEVFEWVVSNTGEMKPHNVFDQIALNQICREADSEYRVLYLGKAEDGMPLHSIDGLYIVFVYRVLNALLEGFMADTDCKEIEVCKRLKAMALSQSNQSLLQDARR